jgi:hypothetical protein
VLLLNSENTSQKVTTLETTEANLSSISHTPILKLCVWSSGSGWGGRVFNGKTIEGERKFLF